MNFKKFIPAVIVLIVVLFLWQNNVFTWLPETKFVDDLISSLSPFRKAGETQFIEVPIEVDVNSEIAAEPKIELIPDVNLNLISFDVGQGLSLGIEYGNSFIVFDFGNKGKSQPINDYASGKDFEEIQLIASHGDSDHIGGMDVLNIPYTTVYYNGDNDCTTIACQTFYNKTEGKRIVSERNSMIPFPVSLTILNPIQPRKFNSRNDNSVVLLIEFKDFQALIMGDCEFECEKDIIGSGLLRDVEYLSVGHHGAKSSTSKEFLKIIKPEVSVINAGKDNSYGHPHAETLINLQEIGSRIYRTDLQGTIFLTTNGINFTVK